MGKTKGRKTILSEQKTLSTVGNQGYQTILINVQKYTNKQVLQNMST